PKGAVGNVLGDHRSGTSVGAVSDAYWSNQCSVNPGLDPAADDRPVFAGTVVVGGDRAGAEVGAGADVGVADVGEVGHLGARADVGVLDLDEGAGLRLGAEAGAGADVGEGADRGAVGDLALDQVGVRDLDQLAEAGVD